MDMQHTQEFSIKRDSESEMKAILSTVYQALSEKGYKPINQIVGYILSEDPTYITTHNNARNLIRRLDRDELLQELVKSYLSK
ncbi:MAG: IreB family regulatory phosphoprotein [Clostridia bacterium]|nr:IreB family regulatory phosphoprotein [Clostridia bacterium]